MKKRLLEITESINEITLDLLLPIRSEKKIDEDAFSKLYEYLDEIKEMLRGKEEIPRNLAGLLFFIYTSVVSEIKDDDYKNPIFIAASELEAYLDEIFWESPFGNER